jgi:Lytic polysaccharide mono-oxygenase, cellulose-degrading
MTSSRPGFGMCGDEVGKSDFMKSGKYANPPSMPYSATYKPGQVANFAYDFTANHGGYLEFYLCDVSKMPGQDISFQGFKENCHYLERVADASCESGSDRDCGPIDTRYPGRWIVPCRNRAGDQGDQVIGGASGKMAYRLPNVEIKMGVIQSYWSK